MRRFFVFTLVLLSLKGKAQLVPVNSDFPIFNQSTVEPNNGNSFGVDNSTWQNEQNNVHNRTVSPWSEFDNLIHDEPYNTLEVDTATQLEADSTFNSITSSYVDPGGPFDPPLDTPIDDGLLFLLSVAISLGLRMVTTKKIKPTDSIINVDAPDIHVIAQSK